MFQSVLVTGQTVRNKGVADFLIDTDGTAAVDVSENKFHCVHNAQVVVGNFKRGFRIAVFRFDQQKRARTTDLAHGAFHFTEFRHYTGTVIRDNHDGGVVENGFFTHPVKPSAERGKRTDLGGHLPLGDAIGTRARGFMVKESAGARFRKPRIVAQFRVNELKGVLRRFCVGDFRQKLEKRQVTVEVVDKRRGAL